MNNYLIYLLLLGAVIVAVVNLIFFKVGLFLAELILFKKRKNKRISLSFSFQVFKTTIN